MRYIFFINPAAGKGIIQKHLLSQIKDYFKHNSADYKIHITEFPGDAEKTAREEAMTGDKIRMFACGGEGTCYEILNGIYGYDNAELGVIPCGSANDFLKFFKKVDLFRDIDLQIKGRAQYIDIIRAGDRFCINGCSVGMDAMVAEEMKGFKKLPLVTGKFAYKLAVLKVFSKKRLGIKINLKVDEDTLGEKSCLFAVIANAPYYGGGYKGAPEAVPYDGQLDFTLVDTVSHSKVIRFISSYKRGAIENIPFCHLKRCEKMSFKSNKEEVVNLDGEILKTDSIEFSIVKNGVKFVFPEGIPVPSGVK